MDLSLEIIADEVCDVIRRNFDTLFADANKLVSDRMLSEKLVVDKSVEMLGEIRRYIADYTLSDFDVVEKIVVLFEENGISCKGRHDF